MPQRATDADSACDDRVGTDPALKARIRELEAENARLRAASADTLAVRDPDVSAGEARFRELADHMPHVVWGADADGRVNFLNSRWYELTGGRPEGDPSRMLDMLHPDDAEPARATWKAAIRWDESFRAEWRIRDAETGRHLWYLVSGAPVMDRATGSVTRWIGGATDIDAAKRIEMRLRDNDTRMAIAREGAGLGPWDLNISTGEIRWAASTYRIWGMEPPDETGGYLSLTEVAGLVHPDDWDRVQETLEDAYATGEPFRAEFRVMCQARSVPIWVGALGCRVPARAGGQPSGRMTGVNLDVTERRRASERRDLLINELNHRVKNTLSVVQSMASQSFRNIEREGQAGALAARGARSTFEGRLFALAKAHDVLTRESWDGADLLDVAAAAIGPYRSEAEDPFELGGPPVRLTPTMALAFAMALHELATNAVKYGSLSVPEGRVAIAWSTVPGRDGPRLRLVWTERGGPPVIPPERRGFGSRMIERSLADELDGTVETSHAPEGLTCAFDVPLPVPDANAASFSPLAS